MEKIKNNLPDIIATLMISFVLSAACNIFGYGFSFAESAPGLLILVAVSILGYLLSYIIPIKQLSPVLWISILAILISIPASPISEYVIESVNNVSLMSVVTPILGYTGVIVGKDFDAFKKVGLKGVIVSIFVIAGTFLISSLLGDFFMYIFN